MKRSELKNEIKSGLRMTCGSWGESYIMIDESAAFDAMVASFGEDAAAYEAQRDDERGGTDIAIFELNGAYYAVDDDSYIKCDDPAKCTDGLLGMHGKWQSFDDEEA